LRRLSEQTEGFHGDAASPGEVAAGLSEIARRIEDAVILSFEGNLGAAGPTEEISLRIAGSTMRSVPVRMQPPIPGSAEPPSSALQTLLEILAEGWWLLGIATSYGVYAAAYAFVEKRFPQHLHSFPFDPMHFARRSPSPDPIPDIQAPPKRPDVVRRTVVDHDARPATRLWLDGVDGPLKGQRIPVEEAQFHIGADPSNDLAIPSDSYVSGQHATVTQAGGEWTLLDRQSRNGTFVDGQKLPSGQGHRLQSGQSIRIGATEFRVVVEGTARSRSEVGKSDHARAGDKTTLR
jgi:hypothetical protein